MMIQGLLLSLRICKSHNRFRLIVNRNRKNIVRVARVAGKKSRTTGRETLTIIICV